MKQYSIQYLVFEIINLYRASNCVHENAKLHETFHPNYHRRTRKYIIECLVRDKTHSHVHGVSLITFSRAHLRSAYRRPKFRPYRWSTQRTISLDGIPGRVTDISRRPHARQVAQFN